MIRHPLSLQSASSARMPGVCACAFGDRTNFYAID